MRPSPKGQIPPIARNSVDLPEPEGPERKRFHPPPVPDVSSRLCAFRQVGKDRGLRGRSWACTGPHDPRWPGISERLRLVDRSIEKFKRSTTDLNPAGVSS